MKAYIGPFVFRWVSTIHDRHMEQKYDKPYWDMEEVDYDWEDRAWYKVECWLQSLYNATINRYLDNKQRTVKIRVDRYDSWTAYQTIAMVAVPVLKQLQKTKHGSPYVDPEDVPEHLRPEGEMPTNGDIDDKHHDRWDWALSEILWSLEQCAREDYMEDFYDGDVDIDGLKAHEERMQNGLRLMGKYFLNLWD